MSDFPKHKDKYIQAVDEALTKDIPRLMSQLPGYQDSQGKEGASANPFATQTRTEGWVLSGEDKARFTQMFRSLNPSRGMLTGGQVTPFVPRNLNLNVTFCRIEMHT